MGIVYLSGSSVPEGTNGEQDPAHTSGQISEVDSGSGLNSFLPTEKKVEN